MSFSHTNNRVAVLSNDTDSDEIEENDDDTDADPTYEPPEESAEDNYSNSSSPLTEEQIRVADDAAKELYLFDEEMKKNAIEESDDDTDANQYKPPEEIAEDNYSNLTSASKEEQKVADEAAKKLCFFSEEMKKIVNTETVHAGSNTRLNWQTKLEMHKEKIENWTKKRKEAFKSGKKNVARRLTRLLKEANQEIVTNEIISAQAEPRQLIHNEGRNKYPRKRNYCLYCDKLVAKFGEHIERCHRDKPELTPILECNLLDSCTNRRLQKMKLTDPIRKLWNSIYNEKLLTANKPPSGYNLIPVKRSHTGKPVSYVLCKYCKGQYTRYKLSVHLKTCEKYMTAVPLLSMSDKISAVKKHSLPLMPNKNCVSNQFAKEILEGINIDPIMETAMNDSLIMKFGSQFHESRREPCSRGYVIREIRDLSRLLIKMKELRPEIKNLTECFIPSNFNIMIESVKNMAEYEEDTGNVKIPSIAYRLTQPLNDAAKIVKTEELSYLYESGSSDKSKITMIDDFLLTLKDNWSKRIGRICTKAQKFLKANRHDKVALEEDIVKIAAYIEGSYRKLVRKLQTEDNKCIVYDELTHMLVTHIMLLIRRRPVDFKHANLQHYDNLDRHDQLIDMAKGTSSELNIEDLELCKKFHIFYVPGKNLEVVPMVLTPIMKSTMDTLILFRADVGIKSVTLFVHSGDKIIKPNESIKKMTRRLKLKKPMDCTGNGLRHQAATFSKLHAKHPQYQDFLASALGHTLSVHKKHYDLPVGILQKIMVCPILNDIMTGKAKKKTVSEPAITIQEPVLQETEQQHPPTKRAMVVVETDTIQEPLQQETEQQHTPKKRARVVVETECFSSSESDEEYSYKKPKCRRQRWSQSEEKAVLTHFGYQILNKQLPLRSEIVSFLKANQCVLGNRTVAQVYMFVRNHANRQQLNVTPKINRYLKESSNN